MQTKLQELTEKIYHEGIEKANKEADKILTQAKNEAEEIIAKAKKDAESILKNADKEAEDLKKNSLNELQLASRQAITDLKQKISELIQTSTIKPESKEAFKDGAFAREIIQTIIKNWNPKDSKTVDLNLLLPASQQKDFEGFFAIKTGELMNKGLEVNYSDRMKSGFKIGPKEEGYLISFTDDDFENFFKAFLRPKLVNLLFEKK
jgi:V/A-type H+-transporting ATPase subunit E